MFLRLLCGSWRGYFQGLSKIQSLSNPKDHCHSRCFAETYICSGISVLSRCKLKQKSHFLTCYRFFALNHSWPDEWINCPDKHKGLKTPSFGLNLHTSSQFFSPWGTSSQCGAVWIILFNLQRPPPPPMISDEDKPPLRGQKPRRRPRLIGGRPSALTRNRLLTIDRLLAHWLQHFIWVHFLYPVLLFLSSAGFSSGAP